MQTKVSVECAAEVKQAMYERAHSVDLDPEIEQWCVQDLARLCSNKTQKKEVN